MIKLTIMFVTLFCSSCSYSEDKDKNPYEKAMIDAIKNKDVHGDILYNENYEKYNNSEIKINGYLDKLKNRLYASQSLDAVVPFHESTTLVLDINISGLINYTCPDTMVQVEATYKHVVTEDSEKQLLVDVSRISDYDTTPKHKGGKGELTVCWEY